MCAVSTPHPRKPLSALLHQRRADLGPLPHRTSHLPHPTSLHQATHTAPLTCLIPHQATHTAPLTCLIPHQATHTAPLTCLIPHQATHATPEAILSCPQKPYALAVARDPPPPLPSTPHSHLPRKPSSARLAALRLCMERGSLGLRGGCRPFAAAACRRMALLNTAGLREGPPYIQGSRV